MFTRLGGKKVACEWSPLSWRLRTAHIGKKRLDMTCSNKPQQHNHGTIESISYHSMDKWCQHNKLKAAVRDWGVPRTMPLFKGEACDLEIELKTQAT